MGNRGLANRVGGKTMKPKSPSVERKDLVFVCRKCNHNLYLTNGVELTGKEIAEQLGKRDCPNCGEEIGDYWVGLWIFIRVGNYKKDCLHD